MSRNGSGVYTPPAADYPAVASTLIESTKFNNVIDDISTAISGSIAADGQTTITANLPMNSKKLTGLAAGSTAGDSVRYEQLAGSASQAFTALSITSVGKVSGATATGTTTNAAVVGVASSSGHGGYFLSNSGPGLVCGSTSGNGIYGVSTSGYGGNFDSSTNHGVHGTSSTSYGVYGYSGTSYGVYGLSGSSYGVVAESDTTSPAKAAFRIVPQDTEPSGANAVGDMYVTTVGVLKICTVAGTPGTWVSVGAQT